MVSAANEVFPTCNDGYNVAVENISSKARVKHFAPTAGRLSAPLAHVPRDARRRQLARVRAELARIAARSRGGMRLPR
jgi:hypothetical protein